MTDDHEGTCQGSDPKGGKKGIVYCAEVSLVDVEQAQRRQFLLAASARIPAIETVLGLAALRQWLSARPGTAPVVVTDTADIVALRQIQKTFYLPQIVYASAQSSVDVLLRHPELFDVATGTMSWAERSTSIELLANLYQNNQEGHHHLDVFTALTGRRQQRVLRAVGEQYALIQEVEADLGGQGVNPLHTRALVDGLVELVANAIYDAPVDESSRQTLEALREVLEPVALSGRNEVAVGWLVNDQCLAARVRDQFGGLRKEHITRVLAKCYGRGDGVVSTAPAGGGNIGFFKVMSSACILVVNVVPGIMTEVTCIVERVASRQQMRRAPRFLWFNQDSRAPRAP